MSRDHRKLRTFNESDVLVPATYALVSAFPLHERFGLALQIRRAAVSVPTNIVEGATRRSTADYRRFLEIALGSARECTYLLELSAKIGLTPSTEAKALSSRYEHLCEGLTRQIQALEKL